MRGVKVVQYPTTLLAMVDSAVGGKTAVDTPAGKNLVGAFHQPVYIFIDAGVLTTLPEREVANGMAEVIKTAAIWDADDFAKLESQASEIQAAARGGDEASIQGQGRVVADRSKAQTLLLDVIRGSVGVKAHIVTIDEKETGLRNLVNFGHSIGHAIEAILTPIILHGECVAVGMMLECELSRYHSGLAQGAIGRLAAVLKAYNLPVSVLDPRLKRANDALPPADRITPGRLLDIMRVDKKNSGDTKKIVLLNRIGLTHEDKATAVPDPEIMRILADSVKVFPVPPTSGKSVSLRTPGSKSISNRALILAALSKQPVILQNLLHSDDTRVMIAALAGLGAASFAYDDTTGDLIVRGNGGAMHAPLKDSQLYLQNAGTAARFLTSVCALVREAHPLEGGDKDQGTVSITGNARMQERPIGALVDALRANGIEIDYLNRQGSLPLRISSQGRGLRGGRIELSANVSSQYVSSLLLAAPYASEEEVVLELVGGQVISQLYIDLTIAMMADFGVKVERLTDASGKRRDAYRIPRTPYTPPSSGEYVVESDASSATYPLAFAALTGQSVTVLGIGSKSLQGDARLATDVLRPMGCIVNQSEYSTTVTGPPVGQLRQLGQVDMEPMTDAFLTAAAVLSIAPVLSVDGKKSTRIYGIANQRVKETNRICAMRRELAKFGIETSEDEDAITIQGVAPKEAHAPRVPVHCYDDHRVAMALSVLATALPLAPEGTVFDEKRAVEKTWPQWWDALTLDLSVQIEGAPLTSAELAKGLPPSEQLNNEFAPAAQLTPASYPLPSAAFFIGMRGSGKSHLGAFVAALLGRKFIDADLEFAAHFCQLDPQVTNTVDEGMRAHRAAVASLGEYVTSKGWPAFRHAETALLRNLVKRAEAEAQQGEPPAIVALGGGIVETPEARDVLIKYAATQGPVVHVRRDTEELLAFLKATDRPGYGEPLPTVLSRRLPWYDACSSAEVWNSTAIAQEAEAEDEVSAKPQGVTSIVAQPTHEEDVARLVRTVEAGLLAGQAARATLLPSEQGTPFTHMLSLTFPDVSAALPVLETISAGAQALELRVDLLRPPHTSETGTWIAPLDYVRSQLALLRAHASLPIVYTVRTQPQGGKFPALDTQEAIEQYAALVRLGLRTGCEVLDLEAHMDSTAWVTLAPLVQAARQAGTIVLGSWHDWTGGLDWSAPSTLALVEKISSWAQVVKLVGFAQKLGDNLALEGLREKVEAKGVSLLAINMGVAGQMSRVLNHVLTPLTHPALPAKAAPGQLSLEQVNAARATLGLISPRRLYLLGSPIAHSLSPTIHNTGFHALGLPYVYGKHEAGEVDEGVRALLHAPDFGGASVTIPLKVAIIPELNELTPAARAIGAVNTVIPVQTGAETKLVGDNTDYLAIERLCARSLDKVGGASEPFAALVVGAGGSARAALYACHALGARVIWLYNRTVVNAQRLAAEVPAEWQVKVVDSLDKIPTPPRVIVSNVPAEGTSLSEGEGKILFPASLLSHPQGGVAVDMSYKPTHTPLMELASRQAQWVGVPGLVILMEQGCAQFERWTGVRAQPRRAIEQECWTQYLA